MENLYEQAKNLITSREKFHICLGLDRVSKVLELLKNPQKNLRIIHVAGTNGKGSVCAILSKIFTCAGYKTGLYTSPHILEYTERIKINQKDISKNDFAQLIFEISDIAKKNEIYLTEFELLTVAAYKYFSDKETDICVIETGLGGRLDATNAIEKNLLSVITSISLDHTDRLGNTIEKIAFEKAGIIKSGCPVLISQENRGFDTVLKIAEEKNSELLIPENNIELVFENNTNYALYKDKKYRFNLFGLWQKENLELALACIEYLNKTGYDIPENTIEKALKTVFWACRMQYIKKHNLLIDGTHNPDGARVLRQSLDYYFPDKKRVWIYGSLKTKDYKKVMQILFRNEDEVYFYNFDYPNSVKIEDFKKIKPDARQINQFDLEYLAAENKNNLIIISGSFYMIGEILSSKNSNNFFKNIAELDNI